MDFQRHFENAFNLLKKEPFLLIAGGLFVLAGNILSLGILTGPLFGGYLLVMQRLLRKEAENPGFEDLFDGFQRFGDLMLFLIPSLIILAGLFFFLIPGILCMVWWMYALNLMVDRGLPWQEAMVQSRMKVTEEGFFLHLVFLFMITIVPAFMINSLAMFFPPAKFLQLLLTPLQCAALTSLYLEQFPKRQSLRNITSAGTTEQTSPRTPPPPPES